MKFEEWWKQYNSELRRTNTIICNTREFAQAGWQACESGLDERVREATAEMRERIVEVIRKKAHEFGDRNLEHIYHGREGSAETCSYIEEALLEMGVAILALPLDQDEHWLEKKLLEARESMLAQIQGFSSGPYDLNKSGRAYFVDIDWVLKSLDLVAAERRALESKEPKNES